MRIEIPGPVVLEFSDEVANSLRAQLEVMAVNGDGPLDTASAAKLIGSSEDYVREHGTELGGWRLGTGPRARWRFDRVRLLSAYAAESAPVKASPPKRKRKSGRPRSTGAGPLAIRGESYAE